MKSTRHPIKKTDYVDGVGDLVAIGIIAVIVVLGMIVVLGSPQVATQHAQANGNALGDPQAPITVEEYADFQCPICGQFALTILPQIQDKYVKTGKVKYIFNHFAFIGANLVGDNSESIRAAEASQCANDQGKFWEYADTLFNNQAGENQGAFNDTNLAKFAQQLGLDMTQFNTCMQNRTHLAEVHASTNNGSQRGVTGTPTLFINGRKLPTIASMAQFDAAINPLLPK